MVNSNAEERPGSVRPLEQALELLLEQQVGERNVVFEGFLRDRGMAGRFELQVGVDFALLSDEFEAGARCAMPIKAMSRPVCGASQQFWIFRSEA